MFEHKYEKNLSRKFSNNKQEQNTNNIQIADSIHEDASRDSHFLRSLSEQIYQKRSGGSSSSILQKALNNQYDSLGRSNPVIQNSFEQGQIHHRLHITQEESQIEKLVQVDNESINYEDLQQYNQELSQMPYSITPLVYSKNSKKDDVRFRKETAKVIILKIRLAQAKEVIQKLKEEFLDFAFKIREQHQLLHQGICAKYYQLLGQLSLKVQQSVFNHKQDYQQLKYELSMIKEKEEVLKYPVESDIMMQNNTDYNTLQQKRENQRLKKQLALLQQQKEKLLRQADIFKNKMAEIENKTSQIRQSNDKLYEYIFDLQQKVAFYKEEIPKITNNIQEESQRQLQRQLQLQSKKYYEEANKRMEQMELLQEQNAVLNQQIAQSNQKIKSVQKQSSQLKLQVQRLDQQLLITKQSLQKVSKQVSQLQNQNRRLKNQAQKMVREKEQSSLYKQQLKRQQSNSRLTRAYSIKQDKKFLQALEIQKLVLQKQNIQLKATIQFIHKNQAYHNTNFIPQTNYSPPPAFQNPSNYQISQRDRQLQMKERQLLELQNYLQDQAYKIQNKQRDIQSQYIVKRPQQNKYKEYLPTQMRIVSHDDYGMIKNIPINHQTKVLPQRKNHFCSSEAQAIIQKVKMRQKMKENGCNCIQPRNCRCQAYSRGSRTSQESNSRQYLKMQTYRPSYNPIPNQYTKKQQKNSKMKLIQQKVRRLKSQLKNSFSTMKN